MDETGNVYAIEKQVALISQELEFNKKYEAQYRTLLKELETQYKQLIKDALDLSKGELARRLDVLNHAHEEAISNWSKTLPRETFEIWKNEHDRWKQELALLVTSFMTVTVFDAWRKENDKWKETVAPIADQKIIMQNVDKLETALNQFQGIIRFLQFAGISGILALLIALLRLSGLIK